MVKRLSRSAVFVLLLACSPLSAEVFSLFPFRNGAAASGTDNVLHGSRLWAEEVEINGHSLELEVSLIRRNMQEALQDLRGQFKKGAAAMNSNSLLFEVPLDSGARKRYYIVELKGIIPMLQFSLVLPRNFQKKHRFGGHWPSEFPLPPGATPLTVMRFPKRNSIYGTFRSPFPPDQALSVLAQDLKNNGWKNTEQRISSQRQSAGEIFLHGKKQGILIVSVQESAAGSIASLYLSRLSGK